MRDFERQTPSYVRVPADELILRLGCRSGSGAYLSHFALRVPTSKNSEKLESAPIPFKFRFLPTFIRIVSRKNTQRRSEARENIDFRQVQKLFHDFLEISLHLPDERDIGWHVFA